MFFWHTTFFRLFEDRLIGESEEKLEPFMISRVLEKFFVINVFKEQPLRWSFIKL